MPLGLGAAAIIGSAVGSGGNVLSNVMSYNLQKKLNKQKYVDFVDAMRRAGATPSAIIEGLKGSGTGSVPAASTSGNPISDFGQSLASGVSAEAASGQSKAALDTAHAAMTNAETERQLALMRLTFEPRKYFADIRKSLADAFAATKTAFLHGSMKTYYDELAKDIQQIRPWKINGLKADLLNSLANYDKIVQDTRTSKAQEGLYKAETEKSYSEAWNTHLQGFRLQWENTLLSYGIDPNKPFWENTSRLMYTNPKLFRDRMDMFITSLNDVDARIQANLGEHYKRNIALGYGLFKLNDIHQKNANNRAYRFGVFGNTISSFIPFAGSSTPTPIGYNR